MSVDPANASELGQIAGEIGADVLRGALRYPSETGGWQLGNLDLSEYLDRYRDQQLVVILALIGPAPAPTYTCGICGFVYDEYGECPRCKLAREEAEDENVGNGTADIEDQVRELLDGPGRDSI